MKPSGIAARVLACALLLAGCGGDSQGAPTGPEEPDNTDSRIATIVFKRAEITLAPGMSGPITAVARDASGNVVEGITFTWSSSDESKVSVSSTGVVSSISVGTATITARVGKVFGDLSAVVYASTDVIPITSVAVAQREVQIRRGSGAQLAATVYSVVLQDWNYPITRPITWTAADPAIVSITRASGAPESGPVTLTGTRAGTTYVFATAGGFRDSALVTVLGPPAELVITRSAAPLAVPDTVQLTATTRDSLGQVYPANMTGLVTWISSDPAKARVQSSGSRTALGLALAPGTATITATGDGTTGSISLPVIGGVATVEISPATITLAAGASTPFIAVGRDASGNVVPGRTFTWSSSDLSLLTVSATGVGTGRAGGSARVTAAVNGKTGSATVTVTGSPPGGASLWREVAAGVTHSCAIDQTGKLYCWGANDQGQLGDGTRTASDVPRPVSGGRTYTHVRLGKSRSCATATGGDTYCWGAMYEAASDVPAKVNAPPTLTGLSMGDTFACALTADGEPLCWGEGTRTSSRDPRTVGVSGRFVAVAGASYGGCGARSNGTLACWVGIGFTTYDLPAVSLETLEGSASGGFVCGRAGGVVNCTYTISPSGPGGQVRYSGLGVLAGSPSAVKQLSAGGDRVCALDQAGAAYCWTRRLSTSLGADLSFAFDLPVRVAEGFTFAQLSVGDKHVCGVTTGGQGFCWGSNAYGQLGVGVTGGESSGPSPIARP